MRFWGGRIRGIAIVAAGVIGLGNVRSQESKPAVLDVPMDSALREEYENLRAAMRGLDRPTDEDIEVFDRRVAELAERLVAGSEAPAAGRLYHAWGEELSSERGRPQEALRCYARAEEIFQGLGDEVSLAAIAVSFGSAFGSLSRHEEALSELEKAATVYERLGDEKSAAIVTMNRGNVFDSLSRYEEALSEYEKAARMFEKLGDSRLLAMIVMARGNVCQSLSRYEEALSEYDVAEQVFERLGDKRYLAMIAANRGEVYRRLSRYEEALPELEKAAQVFGELGDARSLAMIAVNRVGVLESLSRFEEALSELEKAAIVFEKLGDEGSLAVIAVDRGGVLRSLARYEEALAEYEKAKWLYTKLGDERGLAVIAHHRGNTFASLSRSEEALSEYEKAKRAYAKLGERESLALIAMNRGRVLQSLSRSEEALLEYEVAAKVYEELEVARSLALIAHLRGVVFQSQARLDEALAEYEKAATVYEKLGDEGSLAMIALNRGAVFRSLSRHEEALSEYEKAATVYARLGNEESLAMVALNRGNLFESMSRPEEALGQYADAAARIESVLQSQVQKLGDLSSVGYREQFRSIVAGTLKSATAIPELTPSDRATSYRVFGTFLGLGTAEMIAERGRMPAQPETEARRFEDLSFTIRQMVAKRDRIREARRKARAEERRTLDDELTSIVQQIRNLELESQELIDEARMRQQVYVGIQYPKAATVDEVQAELDPGVALLEFAVDGGEVFAFVTTRNAQRLVALGDAAEVLDDVEHVRSAMAQKAAPPPDPRRLRGLGARLLDPLLTGLPTEPRIDTLLIAGHGDLARIPFEILLLEDPKEGTKASEGTLLLSKYDVAYVHSGTVMRAMRQDAQRRATERRTGPEYVAFGFPFDAEAEGDKDVAAAGLVLAERAGRAPLPGTAAEVVEIAKLLAVDDAEARSLTADATEMREVHGERFALFLRTAATEKALKDNPAVRTARILHLACHGEADLISPALSRLVLARSGTIEKVTGEDGYVYERELRDLGIAAELLVLSACETNAGKLHPLEGITGLSRAGLAAGAESVISTFWRVEDEAARALMMDFYRRLFEGGITRIAALSAAKRGAIQRGLPMKTWSAYALWDARTR